MIERLLAREVNKRVSVSSSEVRRYYQDNPEEFEKPEQVRVRQIVVATEAEARKVLALLQAGTDFAALAREKSTAPEAEARRRSGLFCHGRYAGGVQCGLRPAQGRDQRDREEPLRLPYLQARGQAEGGQDRPRRGVQGNCREAAPGKRGQRYKAWLKELRSRTKFEVNYQALEQ